MKSHPNQGLFNGFQYADLAALHKALIGLRNHGDLSFEGHLRVNRLLILVEEAEGEPDVDEHWLLEALENETQA